MSPPRLLADLDIGQFCRRATFCNINLEFDARHQLPTGPAMSAEEQKVHLLAFEII
jgi:hypothetical protein